MTRFVDEQLSATIKTGMPNAERDCAQGRVLAVRRSPREEESGRAPLPFPLTRLILARGLVFFLSAKKQSLITQPNAF